jgi:hypothetical protein
VIRRAIVFSVVCAMLIVLAPGQLVSAQEAPSAPVAPSESRPHGLTYGQWNARWWQWLFSVPASKNPALADNGAVDCRVGQSGKVWFLAGHFQGSGSFTRACTVPAGKALFIPLINSWADNVCNTPPLNTPPLTVDQLHANAAAAVIPPNKLHASIDGKAMEPHRAISPVFSYTLPPSPDNLIDAAFGVSLPGLCWPSLTVKPAVADGFYVMLDPLNEGSHSLIFAGSGPGITLDLRYTLKVRDRN